MTPDATSVRIGVERLDALVNLAGELLPLLERGRAHAGALRRLAREAASLRRRAGGHEAGDARPIAREVAALADGLERLARDYAGIAAATSEGLAGLRDEVLSLRLTPVAAAFAPLPRAARDLARRLGKEARLDLAGAEVELDHRVVEALAHPLVHLVHNAVDHGLEPPDERVARGKPAEGRVRVAARVRGGRVVVSVADDGRGLDPAALRATAIARGIVPAERAGALSDEDALQLVFRPGFTTASRITETSGRGVGMDAVRASVERLGGRVRVLNAPGRGLTVELDLPPSLAITRVVLMGAGARELAIPIAALEQVVELRPDDLLDEDGLPAARLGGRTRRLVPLARLWGDDVPAAGDGAPRALAAVLATGQRRVALLVDRVAEECDVVVRPLGALLGPLTLLQGGAVLADGRVVLVLDPTGLGEWRRRAHPVPALPGGAPTARRVLVVEDTPTSREIVRRVLVAAGFVVDVAPDGLAALELLAGAACDAVVTDLELPRLGGLDLIARLRADPRLAALPVVVLSTHASAADRQSAAEAGANAYLTKGAFDQDELVALLRGLVGAACPSSALEPSAGTSGLKPLGKPSPVWLTSRLQESTGE